MAAKRKGKTIPPLKTLSIERWGEDMFKSWKCGSDRSFEPTMQRFIDLNRKELEFLGITARIVTVDFKAALEVETSGFIGAVAVKAPNTGLIAADLVVTGRFGEDSSEIIDFVGDKIRPEYSESFKLLHTPTVSPPVSLECCRYVDLYLEAEHTSWRHFVNEKRRERFPSSATMWDEYACRVSVDPLQSLNFNNRINTLTDRHRERFQVNYALAMALDKIEHSMLPPGTMLAYGHRIERARRLLQQRKTEPADSIPIHGYDISIIKKLKHAANLVLADKTESKAAWRLDYTEFFERYVQYLFSNAARMKGGSIRCNQRYGIYGGVKPAWGMSHLEPDIVIATAEEIIVADAKYKSHFYNWDSATEDLRETFRHDLHQVLAYSALVSTSAQRCTRCVLMYPYTRFSRHDLMTGADGTVRVSIVGVPFTRNSVRDTIDSLADLL